ncbi:hypothetical protein ACNKHQ_12160 [Shigella flexneri]
MAGGWGSRLWPLSRVLPQAVPLPERGHDVLQASG